MKTLLKQARDALTANVLGTSGRMPKTHAAIAAIEAELAKPDQQPVATSTTQPLLIKSKSSDGRRT